MPLEPGPAQVQLSALVGRWRTEGRTKEIADTAAARIEAVDIYQWLPGGFALLHTVDAQVGEEHVEGAEIIGWDPARSAYVTQYFGSDGPNAYEASFVEAGTELVWSMRSDTDRFTGAFEDGGNRIDGRWERLDEEKSWQPWMEITLTRVT